MSLIATANDFWRLRLMLHPKLRSTLADVRAMSLREMIALHAALDVIDEHELAALDNLQGEAEALRSKSQR